MFTIQEDSSNASLCRRTDLSVLGLGGIVRESEKQARHGDLLFQGEIESYNGTR